MPSPAHPLAAIFAAAATGGFPAPDGTVQLHPPHVYTHAVVAFSGHTVLLTDRSAADVADRRLDAFGGSMHPRHVLWLAGEREIGGSCRWSCCPVLSTATAAGGPSLPLG